MTDSDIFYSRAITDEARLQIQLTEIKYEMPRMREIAWLSAGNERPGIGGRGDMKLM
jgi:GTPase